MWNLCGEGKRNFGINTASPSNAKLQIVGGVQNVANEETAIKISSGLNNVKIELENTATNGKKYEVRSTNTSSFDITDRTGGATRYSIDSSGNHSFTGASVKFGGFDVALKPKFAGIFFASGTTANNG